MFLLYLLSISLASNHMLIPNVVTEVVSHQHSLDDTRLTNISRILVDGNSATQILEDKHFLEELADVTPAEVQQIVSLVNKVITKANGDINALDNAVKNLQKLQKEAEQNHRISERALEKTNTALTQANQALKDKIDQRNDEKPTLINQKVILEKVLGLIQGMHDCPANTILYGKYCYATPDYQKCNASSAFGVCAQKCQKEFISIPTGWEIAPYSKDVVSNVVINNAFGTDCLLFSNGFGYHGATFKNDAKLGTPCGKYLEKKGNLYRATSCSFKILMRKERGH